MTQYEEDYIKYIYAKTELKNRVIKIAEIAADFMYSKQAVIEMVKKMEVRGYLQYIPYKGVTLTAEGKKFGARMVRVHRLWELFLVNELGMKWHEIDDEAHLLEHATSELLEAKLYEYLGKPEFCPHGSPIPDENGEIKFKSYQTLEQARVGDTFTVKKVKDEPSLLKYLEGRGISIGAEIVIQSILEYDGLINAKKGKDDVFISRESAKLIYGIIKV
ncbi:MAG: metal-dependent transcriptional regulator [Clostridia bacterium]|nr:metal-dependent transcriptional regulator [Clostridia bacterium]